MSGIVREAFRKRGYDAYSCDILPSEIPSEFIFKCNNCNNEAKVEENYK